MNSNCTSVPSVPGCDALPSTSSAPVVTAEVLRGRPNVMMLLKFGQGAYRRERRAQEERLLREKLSESEDWEDAYDFVQAGLHKWLPHIQTD